MTDRNYRTLLGLLILVALYFNLDWLMIGLITVLLTESLTNMRIPRLICMVRNCALHEQRFVYVDAAQLPEPRFMLEAERLWRLVVGGFLVLGYIYADLLWFFPWFMGFAIFGAGLSGVCPVLLAIRWLGFR